MSKYFFILLTILFAFSLGKAFSEETKTAEKGNKAVVEEEREEEENFEEKNKFSNEGIEKFKVTGTRIRRIDFEGPSPVTVWTKEDLDDKGYFNVGDFFNNTNLSNFGSVRVHGRSTLTLVNSTRMVFGEANNAVNTIPKRIVDIIPNSAIERVEVLRDGSSALYGSDVVGGVVNIITKKDLTAPEISLKLATPTLYSFHRGGSQMEGSAAFGKKFSNWSFLSTLQLQYDDGLKQIRRKKWYGIDPIFFNIKGVENCPEGKKKTSQGCLYDTLPYNYIFANIFDASSYNYLEYKLSGDMSLYGQLVGFWHHSTVPDQPFYGNLKIPVGHKMSVGGGSALELENLFLTGSDSLARSFFLDGLVGLKGYLSKTWDFDLNMKWSSVLDKTTKTDYLYKEDLTKSIVSGSYDPFDPNKKDLSTIQKHDVVYKNFDTKLFGTLDLSGETGLWGIDMSAGLQAHHNNYTHTFDPLVQQGKIFAEKPGETASKFSRTVLAAYLEGIKSFSDMVEVQVAGRADHYSDFGWTFNPKLAVRFQPSSQILFRSSVGTAFEAPGLIELYTPAKPSDIWVNDTVACYNQLKASNHFEPIYTSLTGEEFKSQETKDKLIKEFLIEQSSVVENKSLSDNVKSAFKDLTKQIAEAKYCRWIQVPGTFQGNKNLKPIKALTASFGLHWGLNEDHGLTADVWFSSLSGAIGPAFNGKTIDAELRHGKKYVEDAGVQYERDSAAEYNPIKNPVNSYINISKRKLYGLDVRWKSDFSNWKVRGGHFYFEDDFSYVLKAGVENFKGMGFVNNLGRSFPGKFSLPKWRNFATLGWKNSKHDISLVLKSVAGVKKAFDQSEILPMENIVDLFYKYNMNVKTTLRLGWYNLLFSNPVLDDSIKQRAKFDSHFFDPRGPHFFVEVRRLL